MKSTSTSGMWILYLYTESGNHLKPNTEMKSFHTQARNVPYFIRFQKYIYVDMTNAYKIKM